MLFLSLLIPHPHMYSLLFSFQIIHSKSKCVTSTQIKKSGRYVTHTPLFSTCNLTVCKLLSLPCAKNFNKNRKIYRKLQVKTIFFLLYKMYINTKNYTSVKVVRSNVGIQTCFLTHWGRGLLNSLNARSRGLIHVQQLLYCVSLKIYNKIANYFYELKFSGNTHQRP